MPSTQQPAFAQNVRILLIARLFVVLVTLAMVALLGRVVQLQLRPGEAIEDRIAHRGAETTIMPRRGSLLDSRGRPLAVSHLGYRLFADPQLIEDPSTFALHIANAIGDDPARIDQTINERFERRYVVLNPLLSDAQLAGIQDMDLTGVGLEARPVREYPQGRLAGQIIGFVGAEHKGLDGLEYALDSVLTGTSGEVMTLRDAQRRPLWIENAGYMPATDGHDVRLSLDVVIQRIAEKELDDVCRAHRAKAGNIVVMDSRNGQLLAIANWPSFDPAEANNIKPDLRKNRAVTDPFEPGSVFKPFLHAAATSQGLAKPGTMIDCTLSGLWVTQHRRRLHDAHPHGLISWDKVLVVSSNIGMGKICQQMGAKKMYQVVRDFGFGSQSGTGLPGESAGIVNPLKQWGPYTLTSVPMGQEVGVTMVQMVKAMSAFANGGMMASPSILAAEADRPIFQQVLDRRTADHTRGLLRQTVVEGTGRKAQSDLYQIWGKTGTAQVPDRKHGGYKPRAYTASFIGGAPLADPRIIVMVTVHEPDPAVAHYGGVVSAPPAKNVIEQTLTYLGVPRDAEPAGKTPTPDGRMIARADELAE